MVVNLLNHARGTFYKPKLQASFAKGIFQPMLMASCQCQPQHGLLGSITSSALPTERAALPRSGCGAEPGPAEPSPAGKPSCLPFADCERCQPKPGASPGAEEAFPQPVQFVGKCCKYEPRRFKRKSLSHASELTCFRQHAAGLQPFTGRNIISFLCQRLTVFALLLYFCCGRNLSKNMYSEFLNSTSATEAHLMIQTNTPYLSSTPRPVSSSALYMSTARVLKEGEINKPDLVTYIILFFFLFLTVTFIVFFINCQLKNSFFATLPYDRSLREARNPWRTQAV
ncbi:small integral membrane protein 32 [Catharus ustulatus]|nr:small integral membrane protein 32 [Catharus ustulatus]